MSVAGTRANGLRMTLDIDGEAGGPASGWASMVDAIDHLKSETSRRSVPGFGSTA